VVAVPDAEGPPVIAPNPGRNERRRGLTLLEIMVVIVVTGVLAAWTVPSFRRGIEQARVDQAAANLRSVWAAQRLYRLDAGTYAADLGSLRDAGLIDPAILSATSPFTYQITAADVAGFVVTATRSGSARWSGVLALDQSGQFTGSVGNGSATIVPSHLFTEGA
jgi:prepilin-type N-terminal cleavage/methylation domain-containing protein